MQVFFTGSALAYRVAGNALQLLNQFQSLDNYNLSASLLENLDESIELGRTLHAKVGMLFFLSRFDELFECSAKALPGTTRFRDINNPSFRQTILANQ